MSIQIVLMLPPKGASATFARHTLAEALRMRGVAPDCIDEAQVALSEACVNLIRVAPGHDFEVLISVGEQKVTMHVLSSGIGLGLEPLATDAPAQDGHGVKLMSEFTDYTSVRAQNGGGSVRLVKWLRWPVAPAAINRL